MPKASSERREPSSKRRVKIAGDRDFVRLDIDPLAKLSADFVTLTTSKPARVVVESDGGIVTAIVVYPDADADADWIPSDQNKKAAPHD